MPEALEVGQRHCLRELKGGSLRLIEAATLDECADERLLDLIGLALIGALHGPARYEAGDRALRIARALAIDPHLTAREAPPALVIRAAAAVARQRREQPSRPAAATLPCTLAAAVQLAPLGLVTWPVVC